jgi:hypothetical protein
MKHAIKVLFITVCLCFNLNANAHSPNSDSLSVYIDNIFVGKRCCVDFDKIPSVLLKTYYCNYLFDCSHTKTSVKDPFSSINQKVIKKLFIEKSDILSTNGILHIRTRKAKEGYLYVNKYIMDNVANLDCEQDNIKIMYVYNDKEVETKDEVMQLIGLRKWRLKTVKVVQYEQLGVITVYITGK